MFRVFAALAVLFSVAISGSGVAEAASRPATPKEQANAAAKANAQRPCCRGCK